MCEIPNIRENLSCSSNSSVENITFEGMADQSRIKLFQSLRKYLQTLGTFSPKSEKKRSFIPENIFVQFCYIQMFASVLAFTIFKANTVVDFCLNYYAYTTELLCIFTVASQLYQMDNISKLIRNCEEFIEKSKSMGLSQIILGITN